MDSARQIAISALTLASCAGAAVVVYIVQDELYKIQRDREIEAESFVLDGKLFDLDIKLPPPKPPGGNYTPKKILDLGDDRQLVHFSGHVPWEKVVSGEALTVHDGSYRFCHKVGYLKLSIEDGQRAARLCTTQILAQLKLACGGELGRVLQVIRLGVHVNCVPDFEDQPDVANGASDILVSLFGQEKGSHVRLAVGASALPRGVCVEVEALVETLKPRPNGPRSGLRGLIRALSEVTART
jgi:enamine deaminase RidA (YjgF/YER057c/UK114 family)